MGDVLNIVDCSRGLEDPACRQYQTLESIKPALIRGYISSKRNTGDESASVVAVHWHTALLTGGSLDISLPGDHHLSYKERHNKTWA